MVPTTIKPLEKLTALYESIHECHSCVNMDNYKALRDHRAIDCNADVFVVSQALARYQQRISGVSFFTENAILGNTGRNFERFLNLFKRTVFPPERIMLRSGKFVPARKDGFRTIYNTEIVHCYPGHGPKKSDRRPLIKEVHECISKTFLLEEMKIFEPQLIMLMGDLARRTFYRFVLRQQRFDSLSDHISSIIASKEIPTYQVYDFNSYVLPIFHASGANPHFSKLIKNKNLVRLVNNVLN